MPDDALHLSPSLQNIWKVPANHQSQPRASNSGLNINISGLSGKSGINVHIACNALFLSLEAAKYSTLGLEHSPHAVLCQTKKRKGNRFKIHVSKIGCRQDSGDHLLFSQYTCCAECFFFFN